MLVRSEGLDVVGIGGGLQAVDSGPGLFNTAKESRQGLVFGKRHAKAEAQTAVDNIQSGAEPTTLLVENATRDQSETASPTSTPTRDPKETKAPEAPAAQTTVETAGGAGDQTIPSTTTGSTGPSTKSPVSENPDASLQSSPSATQETTQEPTKNANNSQSTTNEEPISPTSSLPVPTQVLSLVVLQPVETPTTTPPTETSPQQTSGKSYTHLPKLKKRLLAKRNPPEVPQTTIESGTAPVPDGPVKPTEPATVPPQVSLILCPRYPPPSRSPKY